MKSLLAELGLRKPPGGRARSAGRTCVGAWVGAFGWGALTGVTVEGR